MAAGNTFIPIVSFAQLSSPYSVTVSGIPSTYSDLFITLEYTTDRDLEVLMRFNGDTGSNYGSQYIRGNQNSASAIVGGSNSATSGVIDLNGGWRATTNNIWISNYANTNYYKTYIARSSGQESSSYMYTSMHGGTWRSTSAINSITFLPANSVKFYDDFAYGFRVNIYGVLEA